MSSIVLGSTSSIKQIVHESIQSEKIHWTTFESARKDLKAQRIKDVFAQMKWSENPWWDFLGIITSLRTSRVKEVLKSELSQQKAALLPELEQAIETGSGLAEIRANPKFKLFKDKEIKIFIALKKAGISLKIPGQCSWAKFKVSARFAAFDRIEKGDSAKMLSRWSKGDLAELMKLLENGVRPEKMKKSLLPKMESLFVAYLVSRFHPETIDLLPQRFHQAFLSMDRLDSTKRYLEFFLNRRFLRDQFPGIPSEMGRTIQQLAAEENAKNEAHDIAIGDGNTFPLLHAIRADAEREENMVRIAFHRKDNSVSRQYSKKEETELAKEFSALSPHRANVDPKYNRLLQRCLYQGAWTSFLNEAGWAGSMIYMIGSPILTIGRSNQNQIQIGIHELKNGKTRVEYSCELPLASMDLSDKRSAGHFTVRFSYEIAQNKKTKEWEISAPKPCGIQYS
jgi:hypothetical protein